MRRGDTSDDSPVMVVELVCLLGEGTRDEAYTDTLKIGERVMSSVEARLDETTADSPLVELIGDCSRATVRDEGTKATLVEPVIEVMFTISDCGVIPINEVGLVV